MAQAVILSVPLYVPDSSSAEVVTGYEVQGCAMSEASGFPGTWNELPGSPFSANGNIVDTNSDAALTKLYRARPVRTVTQNSTVYTLDTPWSRPFYAIDPLYDASFTSLLLPILRSTYLADAGTPQINGTEVLETSGAGQGLWVPDGTTTRFSLQYVENDDPIHVLEGWYKLTHGDTLLQPDVDYTVDCQNGVVEFSTAPAVDDYLRFEFRKVDFLNQDLLSGLQSALNALSMYGINGYQLYKQNNLYYLNKPLANPDLGDLVCKIAVRNMRDGLTEQALRSDATWRDGGDQYDPQPNRALQFLVQKLDLSDKLIRQLANGWIRSNTRVRSRGDFDIMFDMSQLSPVSIGMFEQFAAFSGYAGVGATGIGFMPFWI